LGTLFLLGSIGMLVGAFCAGFVSSNLNHRGSILTAVFGAAAVLVVASFANSIWYLGACLVALGFLAGLQTPSSVATITAMVRTQDWGKALSVQQLGPPLSLVVAPLFAAVLLASFSWETALRALAVVCALLGVIFLAFRGVGAFPGDVPTPAMLKPVVKIRSFWAMVFLFALAIGAQVGIYSILPLYMTQERTLSASKANTLIGLANVVPLAMVFVSGRISDKLGPKPTMSLFLALAGIFAVCTGLLSGIPMEISIFLLAASAVGFFPPGFSALSHIVQPVCRSIASSFGPPFAFLLGGGLLPLALGSLGPHHFGKGIAITGAVIFVGSGATLMVTILKDLGEGC
jgi:NNP family nitrate/nitrite transporter-like MFS transporter